MEQHNRWIMGNKERERERERCRMYTKRKEEICEGV